MRNSVVVSFEDQMIKVIYASSRRGRFIVKDARTLQEAEFDDFLENEKAREFIVVNNFKESYQDTITVPVVKKKYLSKIIEIEIRKKCRFTDFSYIYFPAGERAVENRMVLDVFVFAVQNDELKTLIGRFIDKGKMVNAVYPDAFSLSSMTRTEGKYALGVSEAGSHKNFFLVNDGRIVFVRGAKSMDENMTDFDMRNIEMTLNYSRQTLRINPSFIALTGNLCQNYNASLHTSLPVVCLMPPANIRADSKIILEYMTALSALCAGSDINLSPAGYRNVKLTMALLKYSTMTFLSLMVLSLLYAGIIINNTLDIRETFELEIRELPEIDTVLTSYEQERSMINGFTPLINSFNDSSGTQNIRGFLAAFTQIEKEKLRIDSIDISSNDGVLHGRLEGTAESGTYAESEANYETLIHSFDPISGMTITENVFELKNRKFHVEVDYR